MHLSLRFLATILPLVASVKAQTDGLTVQTHQGEVQGSFASPQVRRFLGIPYAVANRWEGPKSPPSRNGTFNATQFGDSCVQSISPFLEGIFQLVGDNIPVTESESCLSVNIWTPSVDRKQNTSVMLWVYGGGFLVGTSNDSLYDGTSLVQDHDDVIVVSFNYRLNIFGQPNAPQLAHQNQSQNFGLLDVDAAVQWVHSNIAAFGGDPERIILFGESAGAIAVDAYSYAHPNDTIVKGLIEQSGNAVLTLPQPQNGTFDSRDWNLVAQAVGCGNATDAQQLACMRNASYKRLQEAVLSTNASFTPRPDGITLPFNLTAEAAAGNFLRAPLFIGTTAHESDLLAVAAQQITLGFTYPVLTEVLSDVQTQLVFTCTASRTVNDRVAANVSSWRYHYQAIFPEISQRPDLRSFHGSEIPLVFGVNNLNASLGQPPSTELVELSKYMQGAWVAFARDPANGLSNYGWPRYAHNSTLIELGGYYNRTGSTLGSGDLLDHSCTNLETLGSIQEQVLNLIGPALSGIF